MPFQKVGGFAPLTFCNGLRGSGAAQTFKMTDFRHLQSHATSIATQSAATLWADFPETNPQTSKHNVRFSDIERINDIRFGSRIDSFVYL